MGQRIEPLAEADWTPEQRAVLLKTSPTDEPASGNWYGAFVRHPKLHEKWVAFGARLLVAGVIPARDRELVVLRTALLTGAEYYWEPHVELGRGCGITSAEVDAVVVGSHHKEWSDHDRALLSAAEELIADHVIADPTWATLARTYDEQQLIELPFLVGHYVMVAFAMRSMGVELEPGQAGWDLR